jgi:hypothetical protein
MLPHSSSLGSAGPAGRPGRRRPRSAWPSVACRLAILGTAALTLGSGAPSSSSRTLWPAPSSRSLGSARQPSSRTTVVPVPHRPSTAEIPVPSGRGRLRRSGPPRPGPTGRPGTARPMQAWINRPPAPKARSGRIVTCGGRERAGRRGLGVGCGCPLGTDQDRCEWQASGTAAEDDPGIRLRRWLHLDHRVRPVLGDHCLVGKSPEGSRQPGY